MSSSTYLHYKIITKKNLHTTEKLAMKTWANGRGVARNFLVRGLIKIITVRTHLVYKACWVWGYVPTRNF